MPKFDYEEMEEMLRRWIAANEEAARTKDWSYLGKNFYTEDAVYSWNTGTSTEFVAKGRKQITEWAFGTEMAGLEEWVYPYMRTVIDPNKGELVGFWRQLSPFNGPDGKPYEILGTGGSWFRYAGNFKWSWQRDWFDLGNMFHCFQQMEKNGDLNEVMQERLAGKRGFNGWVSLSDFHWQDGIINRED